MAGVIAVSPKFQFESSAGAPLVNGTVDVYVAGTVTRSNTWQDQAQTTLNANPIVLDSRGEALIWLDPAITYDFVLKNSGGVTQYTVEDISGSDTFVQAGTGAVTRTAQSKMRDIVSVLDFGAVGDGVTNDSAAVQLAVNYCIANNKDLDIVGLCRLATPINIDRQVDNALYDSYFTILTNSGGGFYVDTAIAMFTSSLTFTTAPVSQLVRFENVRFVANSAATAAYVLNDARFLRTVFSGCSFSKIKCLSAPTVLTQSIYFFGCNMRRWTGTFFSSKLTTFDLKVHGCLMEAGGDGFDIDYPVGTSFLGNTIEGMTVFAIKYIGGYAFTINGNYFEDNGNNDANGCSIDGSAATGVDASEAVLITGNYFSGDTDTPTKPQVKWGEATACVSSGNLCTTTLHSFITNSRPQVIGDYARTVLSNLSATLKSANLYMGQRQGYGTGDPLAENHNYATAKPKWLSTDATLGANYGAYFTGYGVTGQGGYAAIGTMQNGVMSEAVVMDQFHNFWPNTDNTQDLGLATKRWKVVYAGELRISGAAGINGKAPVVNVAAPADATDLATAITLVNDIKLRLDNFGIYT